MAFGLHVFLVSEAAQRPLSHTKRTCRQIAAPTRRGHTKEAHRDLTASGGMAFGEGAPQIVIASGAGRTLRVRLEKQSRRKLWEPKSGLLGWRSQ